MLGLVGKIYLLLFAWVLGIEVSHGINALLLWLG